MLVFVLILFLSRLALPVDSTLEALCDWLFYGTWIKMLIFNIFYFYNTSFPPTTSIFSYDYVIIVIVICNV